MQENSGKVKSWGIVELTLVQVETTHVTCSALVASCCCASMSKFEMKHVCHLAGKSTGAGVA